MNRRPEVDSALVIPTSRQDTGQFFKHAPYLEQDEFHELPGDLSGSRHESILVRL